MELSKRSLVIFCLGWLTSLLLTSCVAGYYYMEFQREAQLSREYADMYNELMPNYTSLLNDYLTMVQQYEFEKQNLTQLLEKYGHCIMRANICIDYKEWNVTVVWYNDTIVPLGYNLLQATKMIAIVNCTYYKSVSGWFVDAINGVWNHGPYVWMWYLWDSNDKTWKYGPVGAGSYSLKVDETVMWRYEIPAYS